MTTDDPTTSPDPSAPPKRPLRLWIVALMNVLVGLLSLAVVVFMTLSSRVPAALQLTPGSAVFAAAAGLFLVASSALALYGDPRAPRWMLIAAGAFYGPIIAQNALLLMAGHPDGVPTQKLAANVFRNSLELWLNFWALRSASTRRFFAFRLAQIQPSVDRGA